MVRKCKACSQAASSTEVKTRYCNGCKKELTQTHFADNQWYKVGAGSRKCMECSFSSTSPNVKGRWTCVRYNCKKTLPKELFSRWMQDKKKERRDNTQICNECFTKEKQESRPLRGLGLFGMAIPTSGRTIPVTGIVVKNIKIVIFLATTGLLRVLLGLLDSIQSHSHNNPMYPGLLIS